MMWRKTAYVVLIFLYLSAMVMLAISLAKRFQSTSNHAHAVIKNANQMECGHWAVLRACELLGIPVDQPTLIKSMPVGPQGHSLKQIADALKNYGLNVIGKETSMEAFLAGTGVRIVHMASPNHFIVVLRSDARQVSFFDDQGRHRLLSASALKSRWTGHVLEVLKPTNIADDANITRDKNQPTPRIVFTTLFVDQGDIPVVGPAQTVTFVYPFRNVGNSDLQIKKVHTSCTCLSARQPEQSIRAGATGEIALVYSVDGRHRAFVHEALVETNDPVNSKIVLRAAGNANTQVHVTPNVLQFGQVAHGQTKKLFVIVRYEGDQDFQIEGVQCDMPMVHAVIKQANDPRLIAQIWPNSHGQVRMQGSMGLLEVECQVESVSSGDISGTLVIQTNIAHFQKMFIPVKMTIVAPVVAYPSLIAMYVKSNTDQAEATINLVSTLNQPFSILSVLPNVAGLNWNREKTNGQWSRQTINLKGPIRAFQEVSGKAVIVSIDDNGHQFDVTIPVYVWMKPDG